MITEYPVFPTIPRDSTVFCQIMHVPKGQVTFLQNNSVLLILPFLRIISCIWWLADCWQHGTKCFLSCQQFCLPLSIAPLCFLYLWMSTLPGNSHHLLKTTPPCLSRKYIFNLYETGEERRGGCRQSGYPACFCRDSTTVFSNAPKKPRVFQSWKKVSVVQMWILDHTTKSSYFAKCKQTVQLIIWYSNGKSGSLLTIQGVPHRRVNSDFVVVVKWPHISVSYLYLSPSFPKMSNFHYTLVEKTEQTVLLWCYLVSIRYFNFVWQIMALICI